MAPMQLEEDEMPPVVEIKEYGNLKKKFLQLEEKNNLKQVKQMIFIKD